MRFLNAGESHGPQLTAVIEGIPSGFDISVDEINKALANRQVGYGRGKRMEIEKDTVSVLSGIRFGKTTGAPITLVIKNKDYDNWKNIMSIETVENPNQRNVTKPRPGHADLNGGIKYNLRDLRDVLERSSARETAIRVAVGALAKQLITPFHVKVFSHVTNIGGIQSNTYSSKLETAAEDFIKMVEESDVRCIDKNQGNLMRKEIDRAKEKGETLGGIVEVVVTGVPIGLGSHTQWDRKLDGKLAQALVSIQAFKGVEIGIGFEAANLFGSSVHDEIIWNKEEGYTRSSNRAGGIEGGMTNGEPIIIRGIMKPIPTLYKPLQSIDINTKEIYKASIERSDVCAVPAASVVAENVIAWEIANAFLDKFAGDSYTEIKRNYEHYMEQVKEF